MKSKYVLFAGLGLFVIGIAIGLCGAREFGVNCGAYGFVVIVLLFPISSVLEMIIRRKELKEKRREKLEQFRAEQAAIREERRKQAEEFEKQFQITEVKYLGPGATSQKRGGLKGAVVGGIFGGSVGAVVGASMLKNDKSLHCFAVKYGDGSVKIREVHPSSQEYKELMTYVKWEDIP